MDYKGYNVARHELGHNVEQVFSLNGIDHWALAGVPNNACTEAFAFIFQHRDLEMLGLGAEGEDAPRAEALAILWNTYEIAGVSLVDMGVWNWMLAFQIAQYIRERDFSAEVGRIARQGRLTPDAWVRGAVGAPLSARALLDEARAAIAVEREQEQVSFDF